MGSAGQGPEKKLGSDKTPPVPEPRTALTRKTGLGGEELREARETDGSGRPTLDYFNLKYDPFSTHFM